MTEQTNPVQPVAKIEKALKFYAEYFEKEVLGDLAREALAALSTDAEPVKTAPAVALKDLTDDVVEKAAIAACKDNVARIHAEVNARGGSNSLSSSEWYAYPPFGWRNFKASIKAALEIALSAQVQDVAEELEYIPWGQVELDNDGKLAIYGARFHVRLANFATGASSGLNVGDIFYRAAPAAKQEDR